MGIRSSGRYFIWHAPVRRQGVPILAVYIEWWIRAYLWRRRRRNTTTLTGHTPRMVESVSSHCHLGKRLSMGLTMNT